MAIIAAALSLPAAAWTQTPAAPDLAAQRAALAKLAMLDGEWVGTVVMMMPGGATRTLRHTERVGPMLDGTLRVIEGKAYDADGRDAGFNALAVISYDEATQRYAFRSYAQGRVGTFELTAPGTGFSWGFAQGPVQFRYTATVKDGTWHEEGTMTRPGAATVRLVQLDLKRIGPTGWPAAGAVTPAK